MPEPRARGHAVSVDVEEWYHSCWVPEYVDPVRRPVLVEELDRLLPEQLAWFDEIGLRATYFVLGEVAERLPRRIRELAEAGHEVACHGQLHLRAGERSAGDFAEDLTRSKALLEDLIGAEVVGFRAPEWSLRTATSPRTRQVAEAGFRYDSSLAPSLGAGSAGNPRAPCRLVWSETLEILELPPLVWGGVLGLPAGGWCGRWASPGWIRTALERERAGLLVVHPWELVDRPVPGFYVGFARFFHEAGRQGYRERFARIVSGLEFRTLAEIAGESAAGAPVPLGSPIVESGGSLSLRPTHEVSR